MFFLTSSTDRILQFPQAVPSRQSPKRHRKPPKHQSDPRARSRGKLDFSQIQNLLQQATVWLICRWPRRRHPRRPSLEYWSRQHRSRDPSWTSLWPLLQLMGLLLFLTRRHCPSLCGPEHILLGGCSNRLYIFLVEVWNYPVPGCPQRRTSRRPRTSVRPGYKSLVEEQRNFWKSDCFTHQSYKSNEDFLTLANFLSLLSHLS